MKEPLVLYNLTVPYMTTIDEIHAHLVHHTDLPIDHHIDAISLLYIDHAQIQEKNQFNIILLHIGLLQVQETF